MIAHRHASSAAAPTKPKPPRPHWRFGALLVPLILLLLAGCGDEDKVANLRTAVPNASPTTLADVPQGIEDVAVTISNGAFETDQLFFQENEASVLHVLNNDDTDYRFRIKPDLVTLTPIPAGKRSDIQFTTPKAATYEGQLVAADSDKVLDTIDVIVHSAGGVAP